ncbi:hypothetical protein B0A55_05943 [Friedmanniomyces simplex]|uniref:Myb-like domain-containing protein n=1 Tax=Friedmanniomyces simplex TaxID=329884 RepID=A0A4U0XD99_9PEZI|nr:hypothetical protein B0A55_05943 [Friedmanniomyces simplex]
MSQFISSAVSGKKAAPKAPVRRRQPPPPPPKAPPPPASASVESQAAPAASSSPEIAAPPSPPQTQAQTQPDTRPEPPSEPQPLRQPTPPAPPPPPSDDGATQLEQFVRPQTPEATQHEVPAAPMTALHATASVEQPAATATVTRADVTEAAESVSAPARTKRKRKGDGAQSTQSKPPPKKQKQNQSSARSNFTVQTQLNENEPGADQTGVQQDGAEESEQPEEASTGTAATRTRKTPATEAATSAAKAAPKRRTKRKSAATVPEEDREIQGEQTEDGEATEAAAPTPKRRRKKKNKKAADAEGQEGEQQENEDASSDPELHEIDANTLSMYELTHYNKYGKVSDREKKMREINWVEVRRKRNEDIARIMAGEQQGKGKEKSAGGAKGEVVASTEGPSGTADDGEGAEGAEDAAKGGTRSSQPPPAPGAEPDADIEQEAPARGLQLRIVNGVIVEDEASLTINRPGENGTANDALDGVIEEENDLTQRLNRTTWLNARRRDPTARIPMWKAKSDPWSDAETERFYEQLAIFGTDFDILSRMFPPKTRRMLKTKFNREERLDAQRINDTLLGKAIRPAAAMSLETYAEETGRDLEFFQKYESAEHADEVIRESMREREDAMKVALAEEEEVQRQAGIAAAQREAARKEGEKKRARGKGRRGQGKMGAGTLGGAD